MSVPDTGGSREKRPRSVPRPVPCLDPYEDCGINGSEMFERLQSLPSDLRKAILESTMESYMENNGY